MSDRDNIKDATAILASLGFPRGQLNDRSALTLLALVGLHPGQSWDAARSRPIGVTPIMEFVRDLYGRPYQPNTRETFRRQTLHQFVAAGLALYNPDDPGRPVNSPNAVYQIAPDALALLQAYGTSDWSKSLVAYLESHESLADQYARRREMAKIPVQIAPGVELELSAGAHSAVIKAVIEEFAPRFAPGANLVYAGDTGKKQAYFDAELAQSLGVCLPPHGKMPDVVLYYGERDWILLVEAVTSHGPVDGKRRAELKGMFADASCGVVYVTALPDRATLVRYFQQIAWETEVWTADHPTHLIHFNGVRFLGPYEG